MTGEDLEPEPTEQDLAMKELLLPNEYEFNWPDGYQKDEFGNTFFQLGTPQFRGGVNPELIPRPDLPPQENRTRGVRMAQLAAIAFFQR